MRARLSQPLVAVIVPLLTFAAFLVLWESLVVLRDIPQILLPRPSDVAAEAWLERSRLSTYTWNTAQEALTGLVVASVLAMIVAVAIHASDALSGLASAAAGAGRALPAVVLYPIVTIFLGTSDKAVHVIVTIAIFPFIVIYVLSGLRQRSQLDELIRVVGGSGAQRFRLVRLPAALPYLMTGIRTCLPLAIITAVIAEYFGGSSTTLGAYIKIQSQMLHAVQIWSAIVYACVLGVVAFVVGTVFERLIQRRMGAQEPNSN